MLDDVLAGNHKTDEHPGSSQDALRSSDILDLTASYRPVGIGAGTLQATGSLK